MRHNILLGMTGSVASLLSGKLVSQLHTIGDMAVVLTNKSLSFVDKEKLKEFFLKNYFLKTKKEEQRIWMDCDEWQWKTPRPYQDDLITYKWKKDDPVLHVDIRNKGSALVIAPCSANTLAKLANGICDNLLTTLARAWDVQRPVIIAPAMNTNMWEHPHTQTHLQCLRELEYKIVDPQYKMLACGTQGMGAMAEISKIVQVTNDALRWTFPLEIHECSGIPVGNHPGAFSTQRKHEKHTGVDLYTKNDARVLAVESGTVVGVEKFTGAWDGSPWWNNTMCILVEGASGVVCYGEVGIPPHWIQVGYKVHRGQWLSNVCPVLKDEKKRNDIPGHSTSMLHMELYPHGTLKASNGFEDGLLQDPTPFLILSHGGENIRRLRYGKENDKS